jgi:hypothetical protein
MKNEGAFRLLAALVAAGCILTAAGCNLADSESFINGTIDSTAYNKSGYTLATQIPGATFLLAADSFIDRSAPNGRWRIDIAGTTVGNYTASDVTVEYDVSSDLVYASGLNITVIVTEYTGEEIAGTFDGGLINSKDLIEYAVSGDFRLHF